MRLGPKYEYRQEDGWNLWILSEKWNQPLWREVLHHLGYQAPANHPQTKRFRYPTGENGAEFFLKIHYPSGPSGTLKDLFRDSKAFRALKQGEAMSERGFHVPQTVAAGEARSFRFLKRAFLLTLAVEGSSLPVFLKQYCSRPLERATLKKKQASLKQLASETRRLHGMGFVHGDLVPTNILVHSDEKETTFFFLDHDRTRHYPRWFPHRLWKRNLVQLNRFVLPGVSLQDRMRFLRHYLGRGAWGRSERRLIYWLEKSTRKRRHECDHIMAHVSFRELMRWNGPFTHNIN